MKKVLSILILTVIITSAYSQATKKITVKNSFPSTKEVFYVLKSNNDIREGEYEKTLRGNTLCLGEFENNQRSGQWKYYNDKGQVSHVVDYDNQKLVESNDGQKGAILLGGYSQLYRLIGSTMKYPAQARMKGTQGRVMVSFIVDKQGKLKGFGVASSVGDGCDEEAVRALKLTGQEWFPAINEAGEPVEVKMVIPITFKLG